MGIEYLIDKAHGDPLYWRYLLVEYPYIRAALEAHGAPTDDEDRVNSYSSSIGNALHNDIIELEMYLDTLSPREVAELFLWANTKSGRRPPYSVRKLREKFHATP